MQFNDLSLSISLMLTLLWLDADNWHNLLQNKLISETFFSNEIHWIEKGRNIYFLKNVNHTIAIVY